MTAIVATQNLGNPALNITMFTAFVAITLIVVFVVGHRKTARVSDFYTGGAQFSGLQNGVAISGDYLSAASFLGIAGAIAVYGYDGFLYSIGFIVSWLIALLVVAEAIRNTGRFTMADALSFRLRQRPVRIAAGLTTLTVCLLYLLAQMAGAGGLVALLLDIHGRTTQSVVIGAVGVLMIAYVLLGGMKGTTWVQIIKACLLIGGVLVLTVLILAKFGWSLSELLGAAQRSIANSSRPEVAARHVLAPGEQYGRSTLSKIDFLSLGTALVLGTAGLPHVLMRFYTVPTPREARKSVVWAIGLIGAFYLMTFVLGYGAAALVGPDVILGAPGGQNSAAPLLAAKIGGSVLLAVISAVAFATILAVVAGLTITASACFAHDLYAALRRGKPVSDRQQVRVSRIAAVVIGIAAITLGILANGQNTAFLVALAFAVAASANLPTILFTLFWKRFNTRGALWSMYGALVTTLVLIAFSPAVSGTSTSMLPHNDFHWFPLSNPGIITIPLGFLLGILGTVSSKRPEDSRKASEMAVRAVTGIHLTPPEPPTHSTEAAHVAALIATGPPERNRNS